MKSFSEIALSQHQFFLEGNTFPIPFRLGALAALAGQLKEKEAKICDALAEDFSQCSTETYLTEIAPVLEEIHLTMKNLRKNSRAKKVKQFLFSPTSKMQVAPFPYGVCLHYSFWKNPLYSALIPIIDAIAGGNTIILKPHPRTPHTAHIVSEILSGCFEDEFVFSFTGEIFPLEDFAPLQKISFWGKEEDSKELLPFCQDLQLSFSGFYTGKNPCAIKRDADIAQATKQIARGKFQNGCQNFFSPEYVLVDEMVFDSFVTCMQNEIEESYSASPLTSDDLSSLIDYNHYEKAVHLLDSFPNSKIGGETDSARLKIAPTLLLLKDFAELPTEQINGPILPVISVSSWDEAQTYLKTAPTAPVFYGFSGEKDPLFDFSSFPNAKILSKNQCFLVPPSGSLLGLQNNSSSYGEISSYSKQIALVEASKKKINDSLFPPFGNGDFQKIKKVYK